MSRAFDQERARVSDIARIRIRLPIGCPKGLLF